MRGLLSLHRVIPAGMAVVLLVAGCGHGASAPARKQPANPGMLVLDQRGRGTMFTRNFRVDPKGPWGFTYAYACPGHAGDFGGDVWESMVAADLLYTTFSAHGTSGRGLKMETGSTSDVAAPNGSQAGNLLSLHIKTGCRWHVRVVRGARAAVARFALAHA